MQRLMQWFQFETVSPFLFKITTLKHFGGADGINKNVYQLVRITKLFKRGKMSPLALAHFFNQATLTTVAPNCACAVVKPMEFSNGLATEEFGA